MAKAIKKTNRRLKKTVRKTLGTLFLISAIVVAAIPTEGLQASGSEGLVSQRTARYKVTVSRNASERSADIGAASTIPTMDNLIPEITSADTIYTTSTNEDGSIYQFAYVSYGGDWAAVILGYNKNNNLPDNTLTIPNTVNAYIQPTGNLGTGNGYVAASLKGEPLYYEALTQQSRTIQVQATDENGIPLWNDEAKTDPTMVSQQEFYYTGEIRPCYATDDNWKDLDLNQFFYASVGSTVTSDTAEDESGNKLVYSGYARSTSTDHQWIKDAAVKYIGNQYLDSTYDEVTHTYKWSIPASGNYITSATADNGVFAGAGNIGTLNIGENLIGVGNYAFYNCTGISQASFGNGLSVIGNWAFAGCTRMTGVNVPSISSLGQLGDHAFYKCSSLTQITVPVSVRYIGDYCFAGCSFLNSVELCDFSQGPSGSVLAEIGWNVFEDCESLYSLILPENYSETVDISLFKGCKSLRFVASRNRNLTFTEADGEYSFALFKEMLAGEPVNGEFYFEGLSDSTLHDFCKQNCFAFSYIEYNTNTQKYEKRDKYELTVQEEEAAGDNGKATYLVNSSNELIESIIGSGVKKLVIPNQIGPYHIYSIGQSIFENNCSLELVVIPRSVQSIAAEAFKGCHNLANVVFETDTVEIGQDAFKTQDFNGAQHKAGCIGSVGNDVDNSPQVKLNFVGNISPASTPFQYAMSYNGRYNNSSQTESYITYYSGWPTNLTVQYNKEKGVSELVNFPSFMELSDYTVANYPYMTEAQEQAARSALEAYRSGAPLTEDQQNFIDSALHVEIPQGIQAIKDGLFREKEEADGAIDKTLSIYGLDSIESSDFQDCEHLTELDIFGDTGYIADQAFADCTGLQRVAVNGNTQSIGSKAFKGCTSLEEVSLSGSVNQLGTVPFTGCSKLSDVAFQGTDYFTCDNSIIYGMSNGSKTKIIECLEGRTGKYVKASELSGITDIAEEAFAGSNVKEIDLTASSIQKVPTKAFADTGNLQTVKLPTTCTQIEDYAFDGSNIDRLETSQYLNLLGQHPFDNLLHSNKSDVTICSPEGSYMYNYAVANGYDVDTVPQVDYYTVIFRDWSNELGKYVEVIDSEQRVMAGEDAVPPEPAGKEGEIFQYWDEDYHNIDHDTVCVAFYSAADPDADKLTVTFQDYDGTELKQVKVAQGDSVADADMPDTGKLVREGYTFIGWDRDLTNIQESFATKAVYKEVMDNEAVVRYINGVTKEVFYSTTIKKGTIAPSIQIPVVSGYTFREWLPDIATAVTEDTDFYALYDVETSSETSPSPDPGTSPSPDPGTSPSPSPSTSPSPSPGTGDNNNSQTTTKLYTLTVRNGSGSGSYVAGSQPIIVANDPASNQEFSNWTIDPADTTIASKVLTATVITMPEGNVTVTANYKAKTTTSSTTGSGNSSSSSTNRRPSNTGTVSGGGTTVVIDKNGLSNTGVVSATVNGSSDDFTIKISESSSASEEIVKALMAEYGNDLSAIKYFPMDISLYDSTGTKKITDTTGLSISITLPLPDSLITYAGNNKIAGVVNSKLDKLTPKFTTISGVSCITFTAEHFSPYVIYVDTNNLTAGTIADTTPKTGDGIHPKWFLSMGLACISIVFFMKKDRKNVRKVRA